MSTQSYFTELVGRLHILELKTLAGSLLLAVLGTVVYRVLFHPLTGIPGPRIAAVTGLWRSYRYAQGTWHDDILKVHKKYGRVVRIAPDEVSVVDASVVKQLFSHGTSALKTKWYNTWMVAPGHNLFAEQEPKLHSALRKRVTAAYSMSSILKFEEYIQGCLDLCFVKFKSYAEQEKAVDLAEWTNALAFDIVGELGYGQQLGHLRTESDVNGLRKTIHDAFKMVSTLGHFPGQSSLVINPYLGAFLRAFGVVNAFEEFEAWCMIRVNARRIGSDGAERADLLSHFLAMKDLDGQNPATVKDILTESGTLIGAGADTTAYGMSMCLRHICTHLAVYKLLQEEIDEYYKKKNLSEPISYSQTLEIPYLKAVISESLRLTPSIPFQLLRYLPKGGISIDGHYIPAGYSIGVSAIAQNHDQSVFGQDADQFRPERYLESAERTSSMESATMTWGGSGSRACIGKNIALVEIHKFIAQILRNFDVELANNGHDYDVTTYWFSHIHDMKIRLKLRPQRTMREVDL